MNYQLIMLPNPILVSDEEIKEGDRYYSSQGISQSIKSYFKDERGLKTYHLTHELWSFKCHKIIAGIPELPQLDLFLVADEIGYVDSDIVFEKANAAMNGGRDLPNGILEYRASAVDFAYGKYLEGYLEGFNANPKKYTEEDIIDFLGFYSRTATLGYGSTGENNHLNAKQLVEAWDKQRQPKVYNVEVEMEARYNRLDFDDDDMPTSVSPKITNNTIRVTKILP